MHVVAALEYGTCGALDFRAAFLGSFTVVHGSLMYRLHSSFQQAKGRTSTIEKMGLVDNIVKKVADHLLDLIVDFGNTRAKFAEFFDRCLQFEHIFQLAEKVADLVLPLPGQDRRLGYLSLIDAPAKVQYGSVIAGDFRQEKEKIYNNRHGTQKGKKGKNDPDHQDEPAAGQVYPVTNFIE